MGKQHLGKLSRHVIDSYMREPNRQLTVAVIGAGGTGSYLIPEIAKLHFMLKKIYDYPGIDVHVYDPDIVEEHNYIRSNFSPSDIGRYKANVIVSRVNKFYGLQWSAEQEFYKGKTSFNVIILAVDSVEARKTIIANLIENHNQIYAHENHLHYIIDVGNEKNHGQVIIAQDPANEERELLFTTELFPDLKDDDNPSCSMAESLSKQSLYINRHMALITAEVLKTLCTELIIDFDAVFVNTEDLVMNKTMLNVVEERA